MCGIAGSFLLDPNANCSTPVPTLLARLRHRGPDDTGLWVGKRAALGHTRLSIIDVPGGHQPIANEDASIQIVFNGEIYNFRELRRGLTRHRWRTRTDTEVLVHLYEEDGPDCVKFLDGMFAFALSDGEDLFLARDPLGVKPLYYAIVDGSLYFASEIKALLPVTDQIEEFPPGHWWHSRRGWQQYFDLYSWAAHAPKRAPAEITQDLRERFTCAVEKRLVCDVPVGVFLSGGLDSSLVAALMKKHISELHSFSVGTGEGEDPHYAKRVAAFLGTIHHERIFSEAEMLKVLQRVIYHLESFDFALVRSAIANYFVAQLASQFVKVVLVGEGSDELFGGYHYLKEIADENALRQQLLTITAQLHNSNLQRVDRMTMAHGLEGREPYLDLELIRLALSVPLKLKQRDGIEKWVLRKTFEGELPEEVLWRRKEKFARGAGSASVLERLAEREISDREFARECRLTEGFELRTSEELYYYRIWHRYFPDSVLRCLSWTASPQAR